MPNRADKARSAIVLEQINEELIYRSIKVFRRHLK